MDAQFGAPCDDFHFSARLFLKLPLSNQRESVLHFFERLQREFPRLTHMRHRENGALILEEDEPGSGPRRWVRLDKRALRFGHFAPGDTADPAKLGLVVLEQAPYHLTLSPLDWDRLEVVFGFDLEYRGNHDQLVAEVLMGDNLVGTLLSSDDPTETARFEAIDCQPYFGMALTPACDLQAYFEVKSRTSTFEVRSREFDSQIITVYLTLRKYFGYGDSRPLTDEFSQMLEIGEDLTRHRVIPCMVKPLADAIAARLQ